MGEVADAIREVITLTENVRGLRDDITRLAADMKDLRERLVRLESREELVVEKTRNAAVMAVHQMNGDLLERLISLEIEKSDGAARKGQPPALPSGPRASS